MQYCKIVRTYLALDEADKRVFRDAIDDHDKWSAIGLERELRTRGVMVSNDTILAHRRNMCACKESEWPNA